MRYQLVVLDDEIGGSMTVQSIAWQRAPAGASQGMYYVAKIYMGLCASDALSATFEDNWVPGSKTLVLDADTLSLSAAANEWEPVPLDVPFEYDGTGNLLVEVQWAAANPAYSFYTWKWETGAARSVKAGSVSSPTGILSTQMSELMLTGTMALEADTFAGIKTLFVPGGSE